MSTLNKYVFLFEYNKDEVICYNSLNGALVLLDKKELDARFEKLSTKDLDALNQFGFFKSDTECLDEIKTLYLKNANTELDIIIEFTQKCNLRCPYCYQSTWGRNNTICTETLDNLFKYIQQCFKINKYDSIRLSLFGGEPLLQKDNLFYIYDRIKEFCRINGVVLKTFLTTNGILLDEEVLNHFDEVVVSITLSNKADHDLKRKISDRSSYDFILNKLYNLNSCFDFVNKKLSIRFNTDHNNIGDFEEFVAAISELNKNIIVDVAYLEEFNTNAGYLNLLPFNDFKKWNSTTAIDLLIKYGLCVDVAPKIIRKPCHGYSNYNIKLFANGTIGLCDAFSPSKANLTLNDLCDNINRVKEFTERNSLESLMQECFCCKDFCLCGGRLFCKKKPCDYGLINLSDFLITYVKYSELGMADMFSFTKTTKGSGNENNQTSQ